MLKQLTKIISITSLTISLTSTAFAATIELPKEHTFPEGVAVSSNGTFYIGSMQEGSISRALPGTNKAEPFIEAGANGLVSVIGVYVDESDNTLWACSSDAGHLGYGVSNLMGTNPPAVKSFDLTTGEAKGSFILPGGGFCNDLTMDKNGTLYVTDSWSPRILTLTRSATKLTQWINDENLGADQWSLNGIDVDNSLDLIYVVNINTGSLWQIPIEANGTAGVPIEITLSSELRRPDGLKLIGPNTLAAAEGASGGMSIITVNQIDHKGDVRRISDGLDGIATFAYHQGSAWVVEAQGGSFWCAPKDCGEPTYPFKVTEVPLNLDNNKVVSSGNIFLPGNAFFPEGTTISADGTKYIGSMKYGTIVKASPGQVMAEPFASGADMVSVLGLLADDLTNTLWACSSDASALGYGVSDLAGQGAPAVKAFDLSSGALKASYELPGGGFCNDLSLDSKGNLYASDSWSPRILRLEKGSSKLDEWLKDDILGKDLWQLNGLVINPTTDELYIVNIDTGQLFEIDILEGGAPGLINEIQLSRKLRRPDGLKFLDNNLLLTAESAAGGLASIELTGSDGKVRTITEGMINNPATFAVHNGSAWVVEAQGGNFWCAPKKCGQPSPPFRLVEVSLP